MATKSYFCRLATLLVLAVCLFSCSQDENMGSIKSSEVSIDTNLLGKWKNISLITMGFFGGFY